MATQAIPVSTYEPPRITNRVNYFPIDVALRFLLFSACLVSVIVMVTSNQTQRLHLPGGGVLPFITRRIAAKFHYSHAFKYFVVALSIAGLYSIITILSSLKAIKNPSKKVLLMFAIWDALMLGLVASATAAAGAVAHIAYKGNDHSGWRKICNVYDKFCRHIVSSVALSLLAAVVLALLSILSTYSLHKRIRD